VSSNSLVVGSCIQSVPSVSRSSIVREGSARRKSCELLLWVSPFTCTCWCAESGLRPPIARSRPLRHVACNVFNVASIQDSIYEVDIRVELNCSDVRPATT